MEVQYERFTKFRIAGLIKGSSVWTCREPSVHFMNWSSGYQCPTSSYGLCFSNLRWNCNSGVSQTHSGVLYLFPHCTIACRRTSLGEHILTLAEKKYRENCLKFSWFDGAIFMHSYTSSLLYPQREIYLDEPYQTCLGIVNPRRIVCGDMTWLKYLSCA